MTSTNTSATSTDLGYGVRVVKHPSGIAILEAPVQPGIGTPIITEEQCQAFERGEDVQIDRSPVDVLIDQTITELTELHGLKV